MHWEPIAEFPDYSVSSTGLIRNDNTDRVLALSRNQHGLVQVGLMKNGLQHKRAVGLLVAKTFLAPPTPPTFDSVINLDGDRCNNSVENLMWRPRWFAVKYHLQFHSPRRGFSQPIQEKHTGEYFKDSWEAATRYGLLDREIFTATMQRTYVWPTYQEFRVVKGKDE